MTKNVKTAQSCLYACVSDPCRVSTFSAVTAIAKCPACETAGVLLRFPVVDLTESTVRIRAALDAAARGSYGS